MRTNPFRIKSWKWPLPLAALLSALVLVPALRASENTPRRPFAQQANVPARGQLVVGAVVEDSEAYYMWDHNRQTEITVKAGGESYGIDITQGYLTLDYGITERWAADLNLGATTVGWRSFDPNQSVQSTVGVMDIALGEVGKA